MTARVVDASAIVALIFDELTREMVAPELQGFDLHAPRLLGFEVSSAALKKMKAFPAEQDALMQAFLSFFELSIHFEEVDLREVLVLSHRLGLTVYDASYLWLAAALRADLVTLDEKLARAAHRLRAAAK